ncbi:urea amidolyase associated protein UAAP1 [Shouchella clausii]|uniref:urea amidolyase associated protein UAAP1 n=1 Tax=Shouchella clausii TaxID=79880 RepID=UPI0031FD7953
MIWERTLLAGEKWSATIKKGRLVTLTAEGPSANLAFMLFRANQLKERYNMPDTLKAQHTAKLTAGNILLSDNGRVMASIIDDTVGWHDPVSSYTTRQQTDKQYGKTSFQDHLNEWHRSGEENFLVELIRQGLEQKDLGPVVNAFSKVAYGKDGTMEFVKNHSQEGDSLTLRTEMDVLFLFSNTPHPLNPSSRYPHTPVKLEVQPAPAMTPDDICLNHCDENRRAFENTWDDEVLTAANVIHALR